MNSKEYFEQNGYVVVKNFMPENMADIFYAYTIKRCLFLDEKMSADLNKHYKSTIDGFRGNEETGWSSYNFYADALTETIEEIALKEVETHTGLELVPTYGFLRLYQKGDILPYHNDRKSCEISTTLCVGYDTSNVDSEVYPNYNWPIWLEKKDGDKVSVPLNKGDMLIYRGCELNHWRETFIGNNHVQCFLHYNQKQKEDNNLFDGRKALGLPHLKNYIK